LSQTDATADQIRSTDRGRSFRIHGLTNTNVSGAPAIEHIADGILLWSEETPIADHNARVGIDILS
jgi:DNA polymerase III epsilon subunit-like protein